MRPKVIASATPSGRRARVRRSPTAIRRSRPAGSSRATAPRLAQAAVPRTRMSHVKPEMADVAVLEDVIAALEPHAPLLLRPLLAAEAHEVVVGDNLGADEAALEIGVDDACGLRPGGALVHGPGAGLLGTDGEEGEQPQQLVPFPDHPVQARLLEAHAGQVL